MKQIDMRIVAHGKDYRLELVRDGNRYRWLTDEGEDTEVSGTALECLTALNGFPGGAVLGGDSQERFCMLLQAGAEPIAVRIASLRQAEGRKDLPQTSTYVRLDQLEEELADAKTGEDLDELHSQLDMLEQL